MRDNTENDYGLSRAMEDTSMEDKHSKTTHGASQSAQGTDSEYFILFKKAASQPSDGGHLPVGVGQIESGRVAACSWDRAFERRADWDNKLYLVGRAREGEVEVFDKEDLETLRLELPNSTVQLYRRVDPPSIYPGKLRSQRTIKEKLTDAFQESMTMEYGAIEFAIMAGGEPNDFLLIISLGSEDYSRDKLDLETITVCERTYPVVGRIVNNQVRFTAQEKDLGQYLGKKEGADYVQWRWLDAQNKVKEREAQEKRRASKRKQRQAKKKERRMGISGAPARLLHASEASSDDQQLGAGTLSSSAEQTGDSSTDLDS